MKIEDLKAIGFKECLDRCEKRIYYNTWLQVYEKSSFLTMAEGRKNVDFGYNHIEFKNINSIEKIKQFENLIKGL
jgi:hypothetical protein